MHNKTIIYTRGRKEEGKFRKTFETLGKGGEGRDFKARTQSIRENTRINGINGLPQKGDIPPPDQTPWASSVDNNRGSKTRSETEVANGWLIERPNRSRRLDRGVRAPLAIV